MGLLARGPCENNFHPQAMLTSGTRSFVKDLMVSNVTKCGYTICGDIGIRPHQNRYHHTHRPCDSRSTAESPTHSWGTYRNARPTVCNEPNETATNQVPRDNGCLIPYVVTKGKHRFVHDPMGAISLPGGRSQRARQLKIPPAVVCHSCSLHQRPIGA